MTITEMSKLTGIPFHTLRKQIIRTGLPLDRKTAATLKSSYTPRKERHAAIIADLKRHPWDYVARKYGIGLDGIRYHMWREKR